jgi:hypothetical protein
MTELAVRQDTLPAKIEFAQALSESSLIPRDYQRKPANVLVAYEMGMALGIAPIVAINEINVINGSPSLSASLMAALARQAGHKVRVSGDARSATCTIVRSDDPDYEHTATWDEAKARAAGLWGKGHWAKDAGTMLRWRAISECVRFACSEVLGGLKYTPEELTDSAPGAPVVSVMQPTKPISIKDAVRQEQGEPALRTEPQSKKLAILLRELDMKDRAEALSYIGGLVGRDVESTKTLTVAEASTVIDHLQKMADDAKTDRETGEILEAELVDDGEAGA